MNVDETGKRPMKIDITIPGTFSRPNPNVTRPITKAAMITPIIVPDPPNMLTPPRTTMVTTSNSIPIPIEGRVEPKREVRQTAAKPDIAPVIRNRINLTRFTRMPENSAPVALFPIA